MLIWVKIIFLLLFTGLDFYVYFNIVPKIDTIRKGFHFFLVVIIAVFLTTYLAIIHPIIPLCIAASVFYFMPVFYFLMWKKVKEKFLSHRKTTPDRFILKIITVFFLLLTIVARITMCLAYPPPI